MNHRIGHSRRIQTGEVEAQTPILPQVTRVIISGAGILILFYFARSVVLPVLLAWVGWMALTPPVTWLRGHRVPSPVAAGLVLVMLGAALGFGLVHLGKPVADWVKQAPETLPRLREKYQRIFAPISRFTSALNNADGKAPNSSHPLAAAATPPVAGTTQIAGTLFTWTSGFLFGAVETGVLLFLLLAAGDRFIYKFARALVMFCGQADTVEISRQIQENIAKYLFSVSIINTALGTLVGLSLSITGMPNAAMWGAMAAVANFIPYFGPVAGIIAVAGAGLLAFDTLGRGLLPAGTYLVWHLLEADLITPILLGRRFQINPFVIFVSLMFCGWLWGLVGALLAMPLLVTLNVLCSRVQALSPFAEFLSA